MSVGLLASGAVFVAGLSTMAGFQARLEREQTLRRWDVEVSVAEDRRVSPAELRNLVALNPVRFSRGR